MPGHIPSIRSFPHGGKTWRVDWFGAVERNTNVPSEPLIEVILSPIVSWEHDLASSNAIDRSIKKTIKVGAGQLPLITVGSLWRDGDLQNAVAGKAQKFKNLMISPDTVQLIHTNHQLNSEWLIPPRYHSVGSSGLKAKCLAIKQNDDPFAIIIPAAEIIRFYYANSSDLARTVFAGDFRLKPTTIVNPDGTGFDPKEKRCFVKLRPHFDDADAWTIGRILNSPDAFNGVMRVHDSLERDSINRAFPLYPEAAFPFVGNTRIRARVKAINSCGQWRYLVFALECCSGPFPFEHLVLDRDNRNTQADEETDIPDENKKEAYINRGNREENDNAEIQNEFEPSKYTQIKRIALPRSQFGSIDGISFEKVIPDKNPYKGVKMSPPICVPVEKFGTGEGVYSENETGMARFSTEHIRSRAMSASLANFIAGVDELSRKEGCSASIRTPSPATEYVPLLKPSKQRQWSYLDSSDEIRRRIVVADASVNGKCFSMIEFEWREGESFKLALLSGSSRGYLSDLMLSSLLKTMAAKQGRWENILQQDLLGVRLLTMKHTWPSNKDFADEVAQTGRNLQ